MKSFNSTGGATRMGRPLLIFLSALALATSQATAQTTPPLTTLYSFTGGSDGGHPYAGLIADAEGNLYGTTHDGAANDSVGTVFKLTPSGILTTLYSFNPFSGSDGAYPEAGLIADASGNLYGTTFEGSGNDYYGTVFKLSQDASGTWTETVLHSFTYSDGAYPQAGLIADADGNLYGTTAYGGANGYGTVFKLTQDNGTWTEAVLHSFTGSDGRNPVAGLIADASGNLYGTTVYGGDANDYYGTVFKLTQDNGTWTETVLHSFTGSDGDGAYPYAGLIADAEGNLYGTTTGGGDANGDGTVFKVTPTGDLTTLYSFTGGSDGAHPDAGLIADAAGNLYGTTAHGGDANGDGTVFKLAPSGTLTPLYSFTGGSDGAYPEAGLIADPAGNLYGTTAGSYAKGYGTVFKLALPATFNGVPGQPNCNGQSISFMAQKYGGLAHAAASLGYSSVSALKNHVAAYCGGS